MQTNGPRSEWYVVSSHGSLLFFIAARPGCTTEDIVSSLHLTPRTVWGLIGDLRRAGMLTVRRQGRRHYYSVNMSGPFRHPTLSGIKLGTVVGKIASRRVPASAR
jgi:DNA-binding transcriptional ArsR family regulator